MRTYWRIVIGTLWGVLLCALLHVLLSGCASRRVTVGGSTHRTDTVYRTNMVRDTMLVKDSVMVSIFSAGDTVYKTREVWRWRDRTNVRVDTVRVPVAVERKLSWWERTVERPLQQEIGAFVCLGAIFCVFYVSVRLGQRRSKDTEKDE